ncbi:hypothetical protein [Pseudonocardia abyssalis]|jgi:hypothetical protein|uniref:Uncharacterized protein n=1 Tax=Pseudonocardia abyssalis TaxID=2792008 RepID=A0ABS6UZP8_9PSEU|nr:hypothetical protein [Pseudonocardia abyssalis]MBW0114518.1 hypothetical protein [Pseudonocardia abyssalis]MBW0137719.1 hypothetical protein [Pseudonocardia abyssalis]
MPDGEVVLRAERDEDGVRHLAARLTAEGDLVVEGQDIGPGVEEFFGEGNTEYEWAHTVRVADLPLLVAALGGAPGDDVLALLAERCDGPDSDELSRLLGPDGPVPADRWSRIGG